MTLIREVSGILMILRNYMNRKKSVGRQQMSSRNIMKAVRDISNDFPILREARREVLQDLMDIQHTVDVLQMIHDNKLKVETINSELPSPFAFNIVLQGHLDILKMEDKLEFLQRMHNMVLAKISLKNR